MTSVLLAEDDSAISEPLARALRREGYDVTTVGDGLEAYREGQADPDLVILDIGLPSMDGLEVCWRLRAEGRTSPILMLTARADEVDAVVGLDAGADDYVTKPFRLAEFLARVRAVLRRSNGKPTGVDSDGVRIDALARRAFLGDQELQLTVKEFDLLRVLIREQGKVVSREQLMREVWDTQWFGSTKTLDMHVSVLRKKLGDDVTRPRFITTVRGVGFRFERPEDAA
ncbi:MAG: response regulator transcription factor [Dermatophilus congolensis]|nr:response regulator transcription factor [Dermatophilus congolensis]